MFEPKYLIQLTKKAFPQDQAVCLGSQLKLIVKNLSDLIGPHIWFCADVDAIFSLPNKLDVCSLHLKKVGNSYSLIQICEIIDQFLSGVFIAIKEKDCNQKNTELPVSTEDEQFRSVNLSGILIEIRTFDTSYFEIYSDRLSLIEELAKRYKVVVRAAEPPFK